MECDLRLLWKKRNEQLVRPLIIYKFPIQESKKSQAANRKVGVVPPPFFWNGGTGETGGKTAPRLNIPTPNGGATGDDVTQAYLGLGRGLSR